MASSQILRRRSRFESHRFRGGGPGEFNLKYEHKLSRGSSCRLARAPGTVVPGP